MNTNKIIKKLSFFAMAAFFALTVNATFSNHVSAQTLIVNYDFLSAVAGTPCTASPLSVATGVTSTFTTGGTGGGACTTPAGTASTASPTGAFASNALNQSVSLTSFAAGSTNFFQFQLSGVSSFQDYMLYFQTQRSGTGPVNADVQYSLNGTTFITFQTITVPPAPFGGFRLDLSAVAAIELQPTVFFRIVGRDGTGAAGTLRIDNFQVQAVAPGGAPTISINDVSQVEGNAGTSTFPFTVSLSAPAPAGGVTFDIATADGTATAGVDYVARALTGQTIAAGAQTYTFNVTVNGDLTVEPNETFFVNITNVTGATAGDVQGLGTITTDDAATTVNLSVNSNVGTEAAQTVITVTATASAPVTGDQTVTLTPSGTATNGADYTLSSTTITILSGQTTGTATFTVIDDITAEGTENATLTITAVSSGLTIGATPAQTISITDNDAAAVCTSVLINEVLANPASGDDSTEYVELRGISPVAGTACNVPANTFFVDFEGDGAGAGLADFVVNISNITLGSNGLLLIKGATNAFPTPTGTTEFIDGQLTGGGGLENGSISFLIITSPTTPIVETTDYDTDNNGTLDALPTDATILDSVGYTDGDAGDLVYSPAVLTQTTGTPDALTRIAGNNTPSVAGSFYNGDLSGTTNDSITYNPMAASANLPANATITPGRGNFAPTAAGAFLSGRVTDARGRALDGVQVELSGGSLTEPIYTTTFINGKYSFDNVEAGETYVLTVSSKRYRFAQPTQVVTLNGDATVNFTGN